MTKLPRWVFHWHEGDEEPTVYVLQLMPPMPTVVKDLAVFKVGDVIRVAVSDDSYTSALTKAQEAYTSA